MRLGGKKDLANREVYNLVRSVYHCTIQRRHAKRVRNTLQNAGNPAIFRMID